MEDWRNMEAGMTRYVKQYGCRRTGTNYLYALIRDNLSSRGVVVMANGLGWKHGAPKDFHKWLDEFEKCGGDIDTHYRKLKVSANELREAIARRRLFVTVCVKHPYPFAASILRRNFDIGKALHEFNQRYRDWRTVPHYLVKHEAILTNMPAVMNGLCAYMDVEPPGVWKDFDRALSTTSQPGHLFDRTYYTEHRYMKDIPLKRVREKVDWNLMAQYGYTEELPSL